MLSETKMDIFNKFISSPDVIELEEDDITISEPTEDKKKKIYTVKVTHPSLRRRAAPNLQAEILGLITDQGYYDIYDEANGWGQLEDGSWIMLVYTEISY